MVLSSLIVKREKGQKEIENNNSNAPWKTYASHICHDPDLYNNTNYIDSEDAIGFRANRDASNNILYIENKKTDTIISVTENKKIKMDGITEFSNNTIFNGIINCNNILDVTTISNEILRTQRIYPNNDATDVTIEGNLTVNGDFNKSGTQAITTNVANGYITGCTILNSVIGRDASGDQRKAGYFTNIDTNNLIINNDVSINNDLIINNNIFLRNIEDASYTYHDLSTLLDISINLFQNFPTKIQIHNIEDSNNNNKFYIGRSNYIFNIRPANIKFIGFYIKNRNFITITSPFVNETINNLYYYIYDLTSTIQINLNISGNFEYISIVTLTRISDSYTINHEFNEIFLYKHDIDLIDKLNTIDDKIINISSFGTSATTINSNFYITGQTILRRDLTVNDDTSITGTLTLSKPTGNGLNVVADAIIGGTLGVTGDLSAGSITDGTARLNAGALSGVTTINCGAITCGDLSASGTITADTSITLDSTTITTDELGVLDGVTPGTASASKALVLNSDKDVGTIRNLTIDGIFTDGNYTFDTNGNVSGLGTVGCGAITSSGNLAVTGTITADTSITLDSTTITTAELGVLENVTRGTAASSKALVLDNNKDVGTIRNLTIDGIFTDGNYTFDTNGNVSGLGTVGCGAITSSGNLAVTGTITADTSITLDSTTITTAELSVLENVTQGIAASSKALVLNANRDIGSIRNLTIDGVFTDGNYTFDTTGNVTGLGTVGCGAITSTGDSSMEKLSVDSVHYAHVPRGVIVMWSGSQDNIPLGWVLCDGSNNATPNLSGKFIVGYSTSDSDYNNVNNSGGNKEFTITLDNLPLHNHEASSQGGGSHNHVITIYQSGNHTHVATVGQAGQHNHGGTTRGGGAHNHGGTTGGDGAHNHGGTTGDDGKHNHTLQSLSFIRSDDEGGSGYNSVLFDDQNKGTETEQKGNSWFNDAVISEEKDHSHTISNVQDHTHTISNVQDHTHTINTEGNHTHDITIFESVQHIHTAASNTVENHTHDIVVNQGGGVISPSSIDNRPPYYVLCYIMKT